MLSKYQTLNYAKGKSKFKTRLEIKIKQKQLKDTQNTTLTHNYPLFLVGFDVLWQMVTSHEFFITFRTSKPFLPSMCSSVPLKSHNNFSTSIRKYIGPCWKLKLCWCKYCGWHGWVGLEMRNTESVGSLIQCAWNVIALLPTFQNSKGEVTVSNIPATNISK